MHSFIFNLRETDDKTTYEDYEVAGMFNRADYVEELHKESRYYKQALEMLKKECHGEYLENWGVTDHYEGDYPINLKNGIDYCKGE